MEGIRRYAYYRISLTTTLIIIPTLFGPMWWDLEGQFRHFASLLKKRGKRKEEAGPTPRERERASAVTVGFVAGRDRRAPRGTTKRVFFPRPVSRAGTVRTPPKKPQKKNWKKRSRAQIRPSEGGEERTRGRSRSGGISWTAGWPRGLRVFRTAGRPRHDDGSSRDVRVLIGLRRGEWTDEISRRG